MKTLDREEIYANRYDDAEHLRAHIEEFIEGITTSSAYTLHWATDLRLNSSNEARIIR